VHTRNDGLCFDKIIYLNFPRPKITTIDKGAKTFSACLKPSKNYLNVAYYGLGMRKISFETTYVGFTRRRNKNSFTSCIASQAQLGHHYVKKTPSEI
jgi:hypothetical protein